MDQDRDAPLTFLVPGRNELADPLYGARANRDYIKQHGIQFAAKPLGRPPRLTGVIREQLTPPKAQRRHDYWQRIPIEGNLAKASTVIDLTISGRYLDRLDQQLPFFVMNLLILQRIFFARYEYNKSLKETVR